MTAADIMIADVPSIPMKTTVKEAVRQLKQNFGDESFQNAAPGLIVVNDRGELAGVFTPLTVITALVESARAGSRVDDTAEFFASLCENIERKPVEAIMERQAISVTEDAGLADVADLFAQHRFQRIPVVRDKKVVGIIYRSRLLFAMATKLLG